MLMPGSVQIPNLMTLNSENEKQNSVDIAKIKVPTIILIFLFIILENCKEILKSVMCLNTFAS